MPVLLNRKVLHIVHGRTVSEEKICHFWKPFHNRTDIIESFWSKTIRVTSNSTGEPQVSRFPRLGNFNFHLKFPRETSSPQFPQGTKFSEVPWGTSSSPEFPEVLPGNLDSPKLFGFPHGNSIFSKFPRVFPLGTSYSIFMKICFKTALTDRLCKSSPGGTFHDFRDPDLYVQKREFTTKIEPLVSEEIPCLYPSVSDTV